MARTTIYFGPPGTGKTHTLMDRVRDALDRGVPPERIAFVAFSRAAAAEARARGAAELGLDDDQMRYWRTLHSTAARQLGVGPGALMERSHWEELGALLGIKLAGVDEAGRFVGRLDDRGGACLAAYALSRATQRPLRAVWEERFRRTEPRWDVVDQFDRALAAFKQSRGLLDYPDLIDQAPGRLPVDVALIDEAQDLTPAQWAYATRCVEGCDEVYVAGDDDQAVYEWAGADVRRLIEMDGDRVVLDVSHRLPRAVHATALGIVGRIRMRQPKEFRPADRDGVVALAARPEAVPVVDGEWLLMARTRPALDAWEDLCRVEGIRYIRSGEDSVNAADVEAIRGWENLRRGHEIPGVDAARALKAAGISRSLDPASPASAATLGIDRGSMPPWVEALTSIAPARRRYYEACLRRDPKSLSRPARVRISTMHGAKGWEADRVGILTDASPRVLEGMRRDPDPEHRVWYVGATRAREELWIVRPMTNRSYRV